MHPYEPRQVPKVQLGWDILIFIEPVWSNHIFVYLIHVPEKWVKFEKIEKCIEKRRNFTRQTVFALICTILIGFA